MAFTEIAERIAKLQKGDPLSVVGSLKPSEWIDKATQQTKHGLSITANNSLSPYDIKKRKPATESHAAIPGNGKKGDYSRPFNDSINF